MDRPNDMEPILKQALSLVEEVKAPEAQALVEVIKFLLNKSFHITEMEQNFDMEDVFNIDADGNLTRLEEISITLKARRTWMK